MRRSTFPGWSSTGWTALAVVIASAGSVVGQTLTPLPRAETRPTGVRDAAGLFSAKARASAEALLREAEAGSPGHWRTLIETRRSLDGRNPAEVAAEAARASGIRGLYLLISRDDRKFQLVPGGSARDAPPKAVQVLIGKALTQAFQRGDFDAGLIDAAAEIRRAALAFGVRDHASMFSNQVVAQANATLDAVRGETGWSAVIETVESLNGKPIEKAALENARASQVRGIHVLIPKKERKVWVEPSVSAQDVFTRDRVRAINEAITSAFKRGQFDRGLTDAVATFRTAALADGRSIAAGSPPPTREPVPSPAPAAPKSVPPPQRVENVAPPSAPEPRVASAPPASPGPAPRPVPRPRNQPQPAAGSSGGGIGTFLLLGGAALVGLWLFTRLRAPRTSRAESGPLKPQPIAEPSPSRFAQRPGYEQAPAGGGGEFLSGMLGGLGGAVLGNMIHDQFGRPGRTPEPHPQGGGAPPPDPTWADPAGIGPVDPPRESYDPNAGVGGDWGTPAADATTSEWASKASSEGVGGDWGQPETGTPDTSPASDGWGPEPTPDVGGGGGGGDWGGGGGGSDGQGGSW
ncbi:MAG: TPM domain-containing protein [Isosphaeraceae bacterium]